MPRKAIPANVPIAVREYHKAGTMKVSSIIGIATSASAAPIAYHSSRIEPLNERRYVPAIASKASDASAVATSTGIGKAWMRFAMTAASVMKIESITNSAADQARLWVREAAKDAAAVAIPCRISRRSKNIRAVCLLTAGATSPAPLAHAPGYLPRISRTLMIWGQYP